MYPNGHVSDTLNARVLIWVLLGVVDAMNLWFGIDYDARMLKARWFTCSFLAPSLGVKTKRGHAATVHLAYSLRYTGADSNDSVPYPVQRILCLVDATFDLQLSLCKRKADMGSFLSKVIERSPTSTHPSQSGGRAGAKGGAIAAEVR